MGRILLIDNDARLRRILQRLFENEGYRVEVAADGLLGLEMFRKNTPSAVIFDLDLPRISGMEVCREITRIAPQIPILVLSANAEVFAKVLLLEIGACDYVVKPFSPRELLARLRAALRSSSIRNHQNIVFFGGITVNFAQRVVNRAGVSVPLTEKECDTLKFMIENAERVISRDELLAKVWGYENNFRTRTVDQHIMHLRGKVERDPHHPVHLRTMTRVGYKFVP